MEIVNLYLNLPASHMMEDKFQNVKYVTSPPSQGSPFESASQSYVLTRRTSIEPTKL